MIAGLGFQISLGAGIAVTREYRGQIGGNLYSHAGTARMRMRV